MTRGPPLELSRSLLEGSTHVSVNTTQFGSYSINELTGSLYTPIMCVSIFVLVISGLGLIGVRCRSRLVLVVYSLAVLTLLVVEVTSMTYVAMLSVMEDKVIEGNNGVKSYSWLVLGLGVAVSLAQFMSVFLAYSLLNKMSNGRTTTGMEETFLV
ncbi:hypothetical protein ScPMuIL_002610 [Solemya velum]